jgi:V8-like Glu-specific endopeptidase
MVGQICIECFGNLVIFSDTHGKPPKIIPLTEVLAFPFSSIASVSHNFSYVGSAFLVSPKLVLSAGHVFKQQSYQNDSEFAMSFQGGEIIADIVQIHFHPVHDLALAVLKEEIGLSAFSFGLPAAGQNIVVAGFPSMGFGADQYYGNGVIKKVEGDTLVHDASTRDGHSGSPVMLLGEANVVVGIHTESSNNMDENAGLAINADIEGWVSSYYE